MVSYHATIHSVVVPFLVTYKISILYTKVIPTKIQLSCVKILYEMRYIHMVKYRLFLFNTTYSIKCSTTYSLLKHILVLNPLIERRSKVLLPLLHR